MTDPSQHSLDSALKHATSVRVFDGGSAGDKALGEVVLYETEDIRSVRELAASLCIIEDESSFGHCACSGDPTVVFYAGSTELAVLGMHHSFAIRWGEWEYDAQLADASDLLAWMNERGVTKLQDERDEMDRQLAEANAAMQRWENALPPSLLAPWQIQMLEMFSTGVVPELSAFRSALQASDDSDVEIAHQLLCWYGSGAGPWSEYPSYEDLPKQLLMDVAATSFSLALERGDLRENSSLIDGALRYLTNEQCSDRAPALVAQFSQTTLETLRTHSDANYEKSRRKIVRRLLSQELI